MTPELMLKLTETLTRAAALYRSIDAPLRALTAEYKAELLATGDLELITSHVKPDDDFVRDNTGDGLTKAYLSRAVAQRFTGPIRNLRLPGVSDLRSFAAYYNTGAGGPYKCLLSSDFAALYKMLAGINLRPEDIAAPPGLTLGHATVSGTGGPAPGDTVDTAACAGCAAPAAVLLRSDFTPSRAAGAGRLTITGTARDRAGAIQMEREFTASVTGDGAFPLVPSEDGDLLLLVEEITLPTNMAAGGLTVYSTAPAT